MNGLDIGFLMLGGLGLIAFAIIYISDHRKAHK